ncbi:MAG: VWA domain-containing protein, partial [Myxococcota bacterium]|nr:VWA domain-containing protein [Myxococcota bacterium]
MPMIINTNLNALNATRRGTSTQRMISRSMERLSSGLRVNGASDDAAGLAISQRMTAQIKGMQKAVENAANASATLQTAEGAMQESSAILMRMRTLAVQAASDTNQPLDRTSIDREVQQLKAELQRVGEQTESNRQPLLDGSFLGRKVQIGANVGETLDISIKETSADELARQLWRESAQGVNSAIPIGARHGGGTLMINGVTIRDTEPTDDFKSTANNAGSAIAKAEAINDAYEFTGVRAIVGPTIVGSETEIDVDGNGLIDLPPLVAPDATNLAALQLADFTEDTDIVFSFDVSGSNSTYLTQFRTHFTDLVNRLNSLSGGHQIRVGATFFGNDPANPPSIGLQDISIAAERTTLENHIQTHAFGGGGVENMYDAVQDARGFVFDPAARQHLIIVGNGDVEPDGVTAVTQAQAEQETIDAVNDFIGD